MQLYFPRRAEVKVKVKKQNDNERKPNKRKFEKMCMMHDGSSCLVLFREKKRKKERETESFNEINKIKAK